MAMNFLDAAADLVPLGFKVFPLIPGRKLPLIKGWQDAASDDLKVITEWAKEWTYANIGVATGIKSGVVVKPTRQRPMTSAANWLTLTRSLPRSSE